MHRYDRHGLGFRVRTAFDLGLGIVPVPSHGKGKGRQPPPVISAGHFKEQLNIGEGAFRSQTVTRPEYGADVELFDGLRDDLVGRCTARFASKVLQHLERAAENGVSDRAAVGPQMKPRRRAAFRSRQSGDGVGDFLFGQAHERTAKKGAEAQGVAPVRDGAGQGDQILDFLAPKEAFAGLRRDRYVPKF